MKKMLGFLFACLSLVSAPAQALTLSASGNVSWLLGNAPKLLDLDNPSFLGGAEATFDVFPGLSLGGFFDYNWVSIHQGVSGPIDFGGIVTRLRVFPTEPWLFDLRLGLTTISVGDPSSYAPNGVNVAFGVGAGLAYDIPLGAGLSLRPRFGYRLLPYDVVNVRTFITDSLDLGVMLSWTI